MQIITTVIMYIVNMTISSIVCNQIVMQINTTVIIV
jgi:hypothetical protein